MAERFRVTYATLSADNEELHQAYDAGAAQARGWLGAELTPFVDGAARAGVDPAEIFSPNDTTLKLATVTAATDADVDDAVGAARAVFPAWSATPWQERVALLRRAADLISERSNELAALMTMEVGKNRLEALGDVEESADLIRYYCDSYEQHDGFDKPMATIAPKESTRSILKPHGVWGVISPFNFPMALAAGPVGAALVAGNTVVLKPSLQGTFSAWKFFECLTDAGLPTGAANFVSGGDGPGRALVAHDEVAGLTFTGSYETGMSVIRDFTRAYPKPVIAEMGGKNATIISAKADLERAVSGVARSAFGLSGQKCSACSRVYVAREHYDEFVTRLAERADSLVVGDPLTRDAYLGPVIDAAAVQRYRDAVAHAGKVGRVVTGGEELAGKDGRPQGHYLAPTVVADVALDDELFSRELFVPFVAVAPVDSIEEGIALANALPLGLTAGFFSTDDTEVALFLDRIEAGVVYVNRPAGATTGAWPGVQPFGGWKGSGSSGKAGGGPYYVQQYLREQSQTVVS
ncbi:aldehyde dehydrogenase family protein [Actinoplanes sp. NPDC051859]|uniref:aldehyde dehydrogenase family protein n=1 Tax=Actinoplanes sp. NPDC051859 TaxID=3363909 RepID=UPI0037A49AD4